MFEYQPTLSGTLLELRPLRKDDFAALQAAASDPGIWEQHPEDRHREEVFRPYFDELLASREALVALDRATGAIVGMYLWARSPAANFLGAAAFGLAGTLIYLRATRHERRKARENVKLDISRMRFK